MQCREQKGERLASPRFGLYETVAAPGGQFRQDTVLYRRHVVEAHHGKRLKKFRVQLASHACVWLLLVAIDGGGSSWGLHMD